MKTPGAVALRQRHAGFTLIELMIVVAIIAVIAAVTIPNLMSSRLSANESAAIATLRNIMSTQSQFQIMAAVDVDLDGLGEYAWFGELAGTAGLRDFSGPQAAPPLHPSPLNGALGIVSALGHAGKGGYLFAIHLADVNGAPLDEAAGGGSPGMEDTDHSESTWVCYAWPADFQETGIRTFVINETGNLLQTDNRNGIFGAYSGAVAVGSVVPMGDAAMVQGATGTIIGALSIADLPQAAADGNLWLVVQ